MPVEWLYRTTLEISLLIGLVFLLRPMARRMLGAHVAYWLWFIPVARAALIDRPELPRALAENIGVPGGAVSIVLYASPDAWVLPTALPWGALWVAGALVWVVFRVAGAVRFRAALASQSSSIELPPRLAALLPRRLQRRGPRYFATDAPGTPFVTGLVRPLVYLPADFFRRFSVEEQKWVVLHELTHAARADIWVQTVWELLRGVFWFNPLVHLAACAMREDQELACDQAVLRGSGAEERYSYGRALLVGAGAQLFPSQLNFFGNSKRRLAMIGNHKASMGRDIVGIALCVLVGVFALTKAPASVAQLVSGEPVSMAFRSIPISRLVSMVLEGFGPEEITGLEQLGDTPVTVRVAGVPAREALQNILNCAGFAYEERGTALAIVPLQGGSAGAVCASIGMTLD